MSLLLLIPVQLLCEAFENDMPTVLVCHVVFLQKPPRGHPEIWERPHAKFGSDLLKTVAGFGEQRTGMNEKYYYNYYSHFTALWTRA